MLNGILQLMIYVSKSFVQKVSPQARDDQKAEILWNLSAQLVGVPA